MISPAIYNFRRAELERWIDQAIDLLNEIDGDPDLEDDELEDRPGFFDSWGWRALVIVCRWTVPIGVLFFKWARENQ